MNESPPPPCHFVWPEMCQGVNEVSERHLRLNTAFSPGPLGLFLGIIDDSKEMACVSVISQRHIYHINSKLIHLKNNIYYEYDSNTDF